MFGDKCCAAEQKSWLLLSFARRRKKKHLLLNEDNEERSSNNNDIHLRPESRPTSSRLIILSGMCNRFLKRKKERANDALDYALFPSSLPLHDARYRKADSFVLILGVEKRWPPEHFLMCGTQNPRNFLLSKDVERPSLSLSLLATLYHRCRAVMYIKEEVSPFFFFFVDALHLTQSRRPLTLSSESSSSSSSTGNGI